MAGLYDNELERYLEQPEVEKGLWLADYENHFLYVVTLEDHEQDCWGTENIGPDNEVMDRLNELCRDGLDTPGEGFDQIVQIMADEFGLVEVPENLHRFDPECGYYVA